MEKELEITLNKNELDRILAQLGETPLKYALPIFQILSMKIQRAQEEPK